MERYAMRQLIRPGPGLFLILLVLAACGSQSPAPLPTMAVITGPTVVSIAPTATATPRPATPTPQRPTASFTPEWTSTPDPDAIEVTEVVVNLRQRRIVFIANVTPKKALLKSAA